MSDPNPSRDLGDPDQLLAAVLELGGGALGERMGIRIVEASAQRVVATMPVEGNTQPFGLLHGGASVVLAETLGSLGSVLHAGMDYRPVGIEINATHHRSATAGWVTGVATPLQLGKTLTCYQVEITDDSGRPVCTSRITCLLRPAPSRRFSAARSGSRWPER